MLKVTEEQSLIPDPLVRGRYTDPEHMNLNHFCGKTKHFTDLIIMRGLKQCFYPAITIYWNFKSSKLRFFVYLKTITLAKVSITIAIPHSALLAD